MVATHPAMFYSHLTLTVLTVPGTDNNAMICSLSQPAVACCCLLSPGYDQSNPTDSSQCPRPGRAENKVNLKIMVIFHFYLSALSFHQLAFYFQLLKD